MTSADASAVVVSGTTYKLTYDVIENNGVPANKFSYYNGSATVQISETVGSYELYYTASGTVFQFQLSDSGMDDGDYIIVDNVSLLPANGYPGLTSGTATFSANTPDD